MELLIVVDMQNDFIDGSLSTAQSKEILPAVIKKVSEFKGDIIFTRDTHGKNYPDTSEGKKLPVIHCIKGTAGWQINQSLDCIRENKKCKVIDKPTFGSISLYLYIEKLIADGADIDKITLIGLCTDICVISNAILLKSAFPEIPIEVDSSCCAGVSPESHVRALEAMKMCQIDII